MNRSGERLRTWAAELRQAGRALRRSPGYAVAAIAILALGLGATAAMFAVFDAVLVRDLPFRDADRLARIYAVPNSGSPRLSPNATVVRELAARAESIGDFAAQRYTDLTLLAAGGPERLVGIGVSPGWAATLGIDPRLGRLFTSEEEHAGRASGVALLSSEAWNNRFGGDPDVVGRVLTLADGPVTIVGVLPRGLKFPYGAEVWFPIDLERDVAGPWGFFTVARLAPGLDLDELNRRLAAWTPELRRVAVDLGDLTLVAVPMREVLLGDETGRIAMLFGGAALLLAIVSANVAGLVLARATGRARELAVRVALGARRQDLVRAALVESVLLAAAASVAALAIAASARGWLLPLLPSGLESVVSEVPFDLRLGGFAILCGGLVAIACGTAPAAFLRRQDPASALASGLRSTDGRSRRRLARALVTSELALALALVSGAGLLGLDFARASRAEPGYRADGLVVLSAVLDERRQGDPEARRQFVRSGLDELAAEPGVAAAGVTTTFPSTRGNALAQIEIEGRVAALEMDRPLVNHRLVSPGFLEALELAPIAGRNLTAADRADRLPVAVVNASFARRYFGAGGVAGAGGAYGVDGAVGRRVRNLREPGEPRWLTVVGVVPDVREFFDVPDTWYLPYDQHAHARNATEIALVVRSAGTDPDLAPDTDRLVAAARRAFARVDPALALFDAATPAMLASEAVATERTSARLGGLVAAIGLAVSAMGIHALLAFEVARRRREIGVRLALGGTPARVAGALVGDGLRLIGWGTLGGAALTFVAVRLARDAWLAVSDSASWVFLAAATLTAFAGLAGCWLPALRAGRLDPLAVLRQE